MINYGSWSVLEVIPSFGQAEALVVPAAGPSGPFLMGGGPNLVQRSLFSTSTPTQGYGNWYNPGFGSPAVSTSDYYLMNGIWFSQPYDLIFPPSGRCIHDRTKQVYIRR